MVAVTRGRAGKASAVRQRQPEALPKENVRQETALTVGKLARLAEVSADTIRFYEDERLLMPDSKSNAGYRLYGPDALRRLDFIKHAQQCGMTLAEIRQLLDLRADDSSCCSDIRSLAIRKKLELEHKIKAMQAMSHALSSLIDVCTADDQPVDTCPILAALESSTANQTIPPTT
ncbi:DNA-binding transcriptional MerR regulator [Cupriavidus metallidurans]